MTPQDTDPRGRGQAPDLDDADNEKKTLAYTAPGRSEGTKVRRFRLTRLEQGGAGASWESAADSCSIGSHPSNDFTIDDATVSRFHCEIRATREGVRIRDLESLNGVTVDGVLVKDAFLRSGSLIRLGRQVLRFDFSTESNRLPLSERTRFGSLVGASVPMRTCFALMERAAAADVTVLLEGETGTGKSQAAQAIHQASPRKDKTFITVDCGAIPANLLESELFGHEKGAFTGAAARRVGAFEEAHGGTVFLDEVGELPAELQPKLLHVLEAREIRRVGSNTFQPVDVRVVAATNQDLRAQVNAGTFRSDLFFRLAVVRIPLPSLRLRPEDLPVVAEQVLSSLGVDAQRRAALLTPEFLARLQQSAWPGNVRELRNYLERCLVFEDAVLLPDDSPPAQSGGGAVDPAIPYADARRRAIDDFERRYVEALLERHKGKVSQAATEAGMDRVYLYRLLRRHGIKT
ncbi:MAG TPA: sigma 54-interacting transcriptional regulator [Myxococcaceae bacterium]|nr:sigma 54-interacting transcriptional regulator [Myxococcaceae bacterium]